MGKKSSGLFRRFNVIRDFRPKYYFDVGSYFRHNTARASELTKLSQKSDFCAAGTMIPAAPLADLKTFVSGIAVPETRSDGFETPS